MICFELMLFSSHDMFVVAYISTFFTVLAEFELFVVWFCHVFHTFDFSPFSQSHLYPFYVDVSRMRICVL